METLTFSLGMTTEQPHAQHHSMATICRMSRNVLFPPQYKTLQEWFSYAFAGSDIDCEYLLRFVNIPRRILFIHLYAIQLSIGFRRSRETGPRVSLAKSKNEMREAALNFRISTTAEKTFLPFRQCSYI